MPPDGEKFVVRRKQKEHLIDSALYAPQDRGTGGTLYAEVECLACALNGGRVASYSAGRRHHTSAGARRTCLFRSWTVLSLSSRDEHRDCSYF